MLRIAGWACYRQPQGTSVDLNGWRRCTDCLGVCDLSDWSCAGVTSWKSVSAATTCTVESGCLLVHVMIVLTCWSLPGRCAASSGQPAIVHSIRRAVQHCTHRACESPSTSSKCNPRWRSPGATSPFRRPVRSSKRPAARYVAPLAEAFCACEVPNRRARSRDDPHPGHKRGRLISTRAKHQSKDRSLL